MEMLFSDNTKIEEAKRIIKESDLLLVGIGSELTMPRCDHDEIKAFFKELSILTADKNYYVITLNTDGLIREANLKDSCIVEPCGNVNKLQCEMACSDIVVDVSDYIDKDKVCPKCGNRLIPNVVENEHYVESYLEDWKNYTKWISSTLNRKLCVLELGVKMEFPSIIRFPFEKIVNINNKAHIIRINNTLPMLAQEIASKGISIKGNPCKVISELAH